MSLVSSGSSATAVLNKPGCRSILSRELVEVPEAALAIIPGPHMFRLLGAPALGFGARQRARSAATTREVISSQYREVSVRSRS
jgi:hypothetical protein